MPSLAILLLIVLGFNTIPIIVSLASYMFQSLLLPRILELGIEIIPFWG